MASDAVVNLIVNATDAESEVNIQLRRIVNDAERRAPDISLQVNIDNRSVVDAINNLNAQILAGNRDSERSGSQRICGLFASIHGPSLFPRN